MFKTCHLNFEYHYLNLKFDNKSYNKQESKKNNNEQITSLN